MMHSLTDVVCFASVTSFFELSFLWNYNKSNRNNLIIKYIFCVIIDK
jgi:hypothetical protein